MTELGDLRTLEEYVALPPYSAIPEIFTEALKICHKSTMPVVYPLLQIRATLPVTVSNAERSFSSMKLLKNYLRSNMKEDRLSSLVLVYFHKEVKIYVHDVIDSFAVKNWQTLFCINLLKLDDF